MNYKILLSFLAITISPLLANPEKLAKIREELSRYKMFTAIHENRRIINAYYGPSTIYAEKRDIVEDGQVKSLVNCYKCAAGGRMERISPDYFEVLATMPKSAQLESSAICAHSDGSIELSRVVYGSRIIYNAYVGSNTLYAEERDDLVAGEPMLFGVAHACEAGSMKNVNPYVYDILEALHDKGHRALTQSE